MPVGGDITFTCEHNGSSSRSLFWKVIIVNRTATTTPTSALFLGNEPGLSTSSTSNIDNPVDITIHNLQLANNGSTVACQLETEGSPSVIIVEGILLYFQSIVFVYMIMMHNSVLVTDLLMANDLYGVST